MLSCVTLGAKRSACISKYSSFLKSWRLYLDGKYHRINLRPSSFFRSCRSPGILPRGPKMRSCPRAICSSFKARESTLEAKLRPSDGIRKNARFRCKAMISRPASAVEFCSGLFCFTCLHWDLGQESVLQSPQVLVVLSKMHVWRSVV